MKLYIKNNPERTDEDRIRHIEDTFGFNGIVAELFCLKGLTDDDRIRAFLQADENQLISPFAFSAMARAVALIQRYIASGTLITVYGDYDADGVCAVSLLYDYLKGAGANINYYIPSRQSDGYGLNTAAVESLAAQGTGLLLTVDCGITSFNEISLARSLGMDVIITDHHEPQGALQDCIVINPKAHDEAYPFKGLCGAAVAAKLVWALGGLEAMMRYIQLIMIATLADIVPLTGENRTIVTLGLDSIRKSQSIGLKALINSAGIDCAQINADTIAYGIVPRLNAAGRMADAARCIELLLSDDEDRAAQLARELNDDNARRQQICSRIYNEAVTMLSEQTPDKVIVLQKEDWNHSVIGIVASRISDRYNRPTILLSVDNGLSIGSARSVKGFNIFEALTSAAELLTRFGGHELAAGLTLPSENTDSLRIKLNAYFDQNCSDDLLLPAAYYDMEIAPKDITIELCEALKIFEPTGQGNEPPLFMLRNASVSDYTFIGKTREHVRFNISGGRDSIEALAFGASDKVSAYQAIKSIDTIVSIDINTYKGSRRAKAYIKDFKPSYQTGMNSLLIKTMYARALKAAISTGSMSDEEWNSALAQCLKADKCGVCVTVYTLAGLDYINKLIANLDYPIEYCFGTIDGNIPYNTVIIAPEDVSLYKYVFSADGIVAPQSGERASVRKADQRIMRELLDEPFNRDYLAGVYKRIMAMQNNCTLDGLIRAMDKEKRCFTVIAALSVFEELDLITIKNERITLNNTKKTPISLTNSEIFNKLNIIV